METLSLILAFIFGTIVGSFLNVVSLRFKTGMGLGGRSKCLTCGKELEWLELIPLVSFFVQKGMCRKCKSKISWQYPLVEFLAGAVFVLILFKFPPIGYLEALTTVIQLIVFCLLIVIIVHDIKFKIIPDHFVYPFIAIAFISQFIGGAEWFHVPNFEGWIAGPILAVPFALLWVVSKGTWMGLGDAKLVIGIGWLLGVDAGINAVILAFWIGAVVSVIWLFATFKQYRPRIEIPFGPYLILGMYLVLIFGVQVMDIGLIREMLVEMLFV